MTLTLLQGLLTVVCLELMRRYGYIEYDPWNWNLLKKVRPSRPPPHRGPLPPPSPLRPFLTSFPFLSPSRLRPSPLCLSPTL